MITGNLGEINKYAALSENFRIAIEYVLNNDLLSLELGKHPIAGEDVYIIRDQYKPKPIEECFFESHRRYIDLQMVLQGSEGFGIRNAKSEGIEVTDEYNQEKDMEKYLAEPEFIIPLKPGNYAIVFPEDLHLVKVKINEEPVEKVVVKIKI